MMDLVELTRKDSEGSPLLINPEGVVAATIHGEGSVLTMTGGTVFYVREPLGVVEELLTGQVRRPFIRPGEDSRPQLAGKTGRRWPERHEADDSPSCRGQLDGLPCFYTPVVQDGLCGYHLERVAAEE